MISISSFQSEAQQKMLGYVHELESRISGLPGEIEAGLDPEQIAKLLGESLRQHFLNRAYRPRSKVCKQPARP